MRVPEVKLARWQRRYFQILEEFFRRADQSTIDAVEPSFGDWLRPNAMRFASTGPAVPFLCARLYVLCVANVCRRVCGDTRLGMPALRAAALIAR